MTNDLLSRDSLSLFVYRLIYYIFLREWIAITKRYNKIFLFPHLLLFCSLDMQWNSHIRKESFKYKKYEYFHVKASKAK